VYFLSGEVWLFGFSFSHSALVPPKCCLLALQDLEQKRAQPRLRSAVRAVKLPEHQSQQTSTVEAMVASRWWVTRWDQLAAGASGW